MEMIMSEPAAVYSVYWLYRVDPAWRRLPATERERGKRAFLEALDARDASVTLRGAYSLVGFRHDADLFLWAHGPDLDAIQRLAVACAHTGLGAYLTSAYTYVGTVAAARYDPEHKPAFIRGIAPRDYISMYPFTKTPDWYLLPYDQRRALMAEHGQLGQRHTDPGAHGRSAAPGTANGHDDGHDDGRGRSQQAPERPAKRAEAAIASAPATAPAPVGGILTNTVDTFGLSDFEFVVAFEADDAAALCRMVEDLRAVEVRRYTRADTPVFLGRRREPAEVLADL
jgi:chlorite dismutase